MTTAVLLSLCIGGGISFVVLLELPVWFACDINRMALWRLRDAIYDDRDTGRLPNISVVEQLLVRIERSVEILPYLSPWQGKLLSNAQVGAEPLRLVCPNDMDIEKRQTFELYYRMFLALLVRQYLIGSWSGIVVAVGSQRRLLRFVLWKSLRRHFWAAVGELYDPYFADYEVLTAPDIISAPADVTAAPPNNELRQEVEEAEDRLLLAIDYPPEAVVDALRRRGRVLVSAAAAADAA
jgi:hypothetical protein